ncbi:MAG: helix-turn-helix domain-containing protein [Pseudomonadota bacterium]
MSELTPDLSTIAEMVAEATGVSVVAMQSRQRRNDMIVARQLFCFMAARHTTHSLPEIGQFLDKRDHSTVLHSVRATERRLLKDLKLAAIADRLTSKLMSELGPEFEVRAKNIAEQAVAAALAPIVEAAQREIQQTAVDMIRSEDFVARLDAIIGSEMSKKQFAAALEVCIAQQAFEQALKTGNSHSEMIVLFRKIGGMRALLGQSLQDLDPQDNDAPGKDAA